ncbi:FecR domain-containing protein [Reichenbachiella sp. MALMAid0571]|uniref:FecR family protein n=1 Tax=Reichenbachiella sp. MALMAid0571 TaxID=3143939 RepID=UPI0032DE5B1A
MKRYDQTTQTLIDKFLQGKASEEEVNQLNSWYHSIDDTEVNLPNVSYQEMMDKKRSMLFDIQTNSVSLTGNKSNVLPIVWKVAISITLIVSLSFFFLQNQSSSIAEKNIFVKSTKWGQKQTLTLSDGSVVKLNSGSSIFFPEQFGSDSREIKLIGEAFFEVVKDSRRPFRVLTGDIATVVLGTSFNVNAYPEKNKIDISLVTGKVRVESSNYGQKAIDPIYLTPGEQASYSLSTLYIKKQKFDTEEMLGWKSGILYFKNANESTLVAKLEKWYGVEISVINQTENKIDISTKFDNATLENVLTSLGYTLGFDFKINNKKVEIQYFN